MDQKFKYTTTFENTVFASSDIENSNISKASLEALKPLIPKDINLDKNIDIIGVVLMLQSLTNLIKTEMA